MALSNVWDPLGSPLLVILTWVLPEKESPPAALGPLYRQGGAVLRGKEDLQDQKRPQPPAQLGEPVPRSVKQCNWDGQHAGFSESPRLDLNSYSPPSSYVTISKSLTFSVSLVSKAR